MFVSFCFVLFCFSLCYFSFCFSFVLSVFILGNGNVRDEERGNSKGRTKGLVSTDTEMLILSNNIISGSNPSKILPVDVL